jgi:hypothetical protein
MLRQMLPRTEVQSLHRLHATRRPSAGSATRCGWRSNLTWALIPAAALAAKPSKARLQPSSQDQDSDSDRGPGAVVADSESLNHRIARRSFWPNRPESRGPGPALLRR